jgi:type IV secretion system protein VirD4
MFGKLFSDIVKHAGYAMLFGKFLKRQDGARLLSSRETSNFLSPRNTGILLDGDEGRLSEKESFQNVAVIARVGAGKTSRFIIPAVLDRARRNCSLVVNDPKGEVFAETSGYMQSRGFKVIVINPEDLTQSARFNPLLEAKTDIEIEQVAEILIKAGAGNAQSDQFWNAGAQRLIAVLLKLLQRAGYVDPGYYTLGNLFRLLNHFGQDGSPLDDFVIKWAYDPTNPDDQSLWEEWKGAVTGNPNAVQSFALTALTALKAFTNKDMITLTSESSFALEDLRHERTIMYIQTSPHLTEYYAFFISLMFRSVFNASMRKMPDRSTLPLYCLMDEAGNMTIPNFAAIANTIRGYKVSLSIVLQSLAQLSARYGQDYARAIQGGFHTYLAYSGADQDTARFFEGIAGKVIEVRKDKIEDITQQRFEYNLLPADAIRRLGDNQALLVSSNRHPAIIPTRGYFENSRWKRIPKRYGAAHVASMGNRNSIKRVPIS